jgi:hypothetical protein
MLLDSLSQLVNTKPNNEIVVNSREEVRTTADMVVYETVRHLLLAEIFDRI